MCSFLKISVLLGLGICVTGVALADNVAVFYALEPDISALKAESTPRGQPMKVGQRAIHKFQLGIHTVYAIKMGSGAVETAVSAEALLAHIPCDRAFSLGPIGALDNGLALGSWVRAKAVAPYQKGIWRGEGFVATSEVLQIDSGDTDDLPLPREWKEAVDVTIASGEIFIASTSYRKQLAASTGAQAVDMNLYGLATACKNHRIPLMSWRIISDYADDDASREFSKFLASYDGKAGRLLADVIRRLPSNPEAPESYPRLRSLIESVPELKIEN